MSNRGARPLPPLLSSSAAPVLCALSLLLLLLLCVWPRPATGRRLGWADAAVDRPSPVLQRLPSAWDLHLGRVGRPPRPTTRAPQLLPASVVASATRAHTLGSLLLGSLSLACLVFPVALRWRRLSHRPLPIAMSSSAGFVHHVPRTERVRPERPSISPVQIPSFAHRPQLDVNADRPPAYWDYTAFQIQWNSSENYYPLEKIGKGKYSEVFNGLIRSTGERCVLKILKPIRAAKMQREVKVLQNLAGGPNIIRLLDQVLTPDGHHVLVFEHVDNTDFRTLYPLLGAADIRFYMFELLKALEFSHSMGVMHRDIKPLNVMIDHQNRQLRLIDWGLAEFYHADKEYNVSVASRYFKGPELLVGLRQYHYGLDMWSLGCTFANMIFHLEPFFKGADNDDMLVKIAEVLGTDELDEYLRKYSLTLKRSYRRAIGSHRRRPWESFVTADNAALCTSDALDLLDHLLRYDQAERLSATEALAHPYFHPLRGSR